VQEKNLEKTPTGKIEVKDENISKFTQITQNFSRKKKNNYFFLMGIMGAFLASSVIAIGICVASTIGTTATAPPTLAATAALALMLAPAAATPAVVPALITAAVCLAVIVGIGAALLALCALVAVTKSIRATSRFRFHQETTLVDNNDDEHLNCNGHSHFHN
jgi:uncharacterized membrane protein